MLTIKYAQPLSWELAGTALFSHSCFSMSRVKAHQQCKISECFAFDTDKYIIILCIYKYIYVYYIITIIVMNLLPQTLFFNVISPGSVQIHFFQLLDTILLYLNRHNIIRRNHLPGLSRAPLEWGNRLQSGVCVQGFH